MYADACMFRYVMICLDLCFPPKVQQNYRTSGDDGKQTKKDKFIEWNTILFKKECPKHFRKPPTL